MASSAKKMGPHDTALTRLDLALVRFKLAPSRSRAEEYIRSGHVMVNGKVETKPARSVRSTDKLIVRESNPYVSRAGLKIQGANQIFKVDFRNKTVLDVGSSTGGFTDYALRSHAKKVIAVDVGTLQLHPSLRAHPAIDLFEKTDIRNFTPSEPIDIVVIDVSFISLRMILPHILTLISPASLIIALCKPQFEAGKTHINKGVIKNETIRRAILAEFEQWLKSCAVVLDKTDSQVAGEKGNIERFFLIRPKLSHKKVYIANR